MKNYSNKQCCPVRAETYVACHMNGVQFFIAEQDDKLCTQTSGIVLVLNENTYFLGKLLSGLNCYSQIAKKSCCSSVIGMI